MSLDPSKLENLVTLADGAQRARCPACAEAGQDGKGEHLRIYPDGRFGCCVFVRDREHRRRIFALAGDRESRGIELKAPALKTAVEVQSGILGRLGRVFTNPKQGVGKPSDSSEGSDGSDASFQVGEAIEEARTLRTAVSESKTPAADLYGNGEFDFRTPRTPISYLRAYGEKMDGIEEIDMCGCAPTRKEFSTGVRGVREQEPAFPHLLADGTLVIPFDSAERYHWWKGGQSVATTRAELEATYKEAR